MSHKSRTSFAGTTFAVVYSVTLPATETMNAQKLDAEDWGSSVYKVRVTEITASGAQWCWYLQASATGTAIIYPSAQAAIDAINAYALTRTGTGA